MGSKITTKKRKKRSPIKILKNKCWSLWSDKIRKEENYICFTCGKQGDKYNTNAGHFMHGSQDFVRENIHCQCIHCNKFLSGNLGVYAIRLIEKYGLKKVKELQFNKHIPRKDTIEELTDLYNKLNNNK